MNDTLELTGVQTLHSPTTERALIGSVLIDPEVLTRLNVSEDDFYHREHAIIWNVIDTLARAGTHIDFVTLCNALDDRQQLKNVGGAAAIMGIISDSVSSIHAESYANIISEKSQRRKLLRVAEDIAKLTLDESKSIQNELPAYIQRMVDSCAGKNSSRPISSYMSDLYDEVQERSQNPSDIWGIKTGFPTFDRVTGGLQNGESMILSGVPGVGKSMIAMQFAYQMGMNTPGAIYSIEMKGLSVARRMVSGVGGVPSRNMKTGRMSDNDWTSFTQAVEKLSVLPVHMDDSANWNTTSLRSDLMRLKVTHNIQWFVLDYLFLLQDGIGKDEIERTALASSGIKRICKELDIAGISVHSMTKGGMADKEIPSQEMLRGSGQVVYDADLITFLTKYNANVDTGFDKVPARDQDNVRVLWFGKGRELEDPRKFIRLVQRPGFPAFAEYAKEA
jgi:replicative DNA helicase